MQAFAYGGGSFLIAGISEDLDAVAEATKNMGLVGGIGQERNEVDGLITEHEKDSTQDPTIIGVESLIHGLRIQAGRLQRKTGLSPYCFWQCLCSSTFVVITFSALTLFCLKRSPSKVGSILFSSAHCRNLKVCVAKLTHCFSSLLLLIILVNVSVWIGLDLVTMSRLHQAQADIDGTPVHLDYTLRAAALPKSCLTVHDMSPSAGVSVTPCGSEDPQQQFLLKSDGTIRPKIKTDLCVSKDSEGGAVLVTCGTQKADETFATTPSCMLQLAADSDTQCMALGGLHGLGFSSCSPVDFEGSGGDFDFVYRGGNSGMASKMRTLLKVQKAITSSEPAEVQQLQQLLQSSGVAILFGMMLPTVLLMLTVWCR